MTTTQPVVMLALGLLFVSMSSPEDEAKLAMHPLQGTWQAVRIEVGGNAVPAEAVAMLKYRFEEDHVTLLEGGKTTGAGTFALDPAKKPGTIDVAMTEGPQKDKKVLGIYEVDGDTLKMCLGEERPIEFSGAGKAVLVELKREKPGRP